MIRRPFPPEALEARAHLAARLAEALTPLRALVTEGEPWLPVEHDTAAEALGTLERVLGSVRSAHEHDTLPWRR